MRKNVEKRGVKMSENRRKWVKTQICHIPDAAEASKTCCQTTMMPLVSRSMGF